MNFDEQVKHSLGYQISHKRFDKTPINNAGDPFSKKRSYLVNTFDEEKALVEYYAQLLQLKEPVWGYCANGSTEAVLNGLWMARKRFGSRARIYASADCHFCVPKIADILCVPITLVPTIESDGRMDMTALCNELSKHCENAIVVLTMGTTIRNAYDDIAEFYEVVNKFPDKEFHVHIDAAFGGSIYPFMKEDWLKYPFDSFNVSFHKFFGCEYPCSLFLTTKKIQNEIKGNGCFGKNMVCLPEKDFTFSCSRNGRAVLDMYNLIFQPNFVETTIDSIVRCLTNKRYLIRLIHKLFRYRESHELSLSVELLDLPNRLETTLSKYGLNVRKNGNTFDTHVYICAHVTTDLIDTFVLDLLS